MLYWAVFGNHENKSIVLAPRHQTRLKQRLEVADTIKIDQTYCFFHLTPQGTQKITGIERVVWAKRWRIHFW